ncbi:1-phosphofructokinase family hexose kinase [Streptacidiphilus jiangxiensis]|uniref:Tagatose 6-phosphate kinase n=1 Tax=Streptacidiphilus jiangxiensis TaxID=235985 RepID=A0A1H7QL19_STRJI|nr:PfkB family carbohydrate kinase [Streptacidiphilus jiangxiensis]SEL48295.1 tagatose 6-phosphate kinase [Streptacidiphilus jiangxiensis]
MIVTVTLNAALDVTYVVEGGVRPGATHRVRSVSERAGGKGVNTARVLASQGEPVLALGLAGGTAGAALRADLGAAGVPHRFTAVAGATRRTVAVVAAPPTAPDGPDGPDGPDTGSGATGEVTGFWEPGPQVTAAEWARFVADFGAALDHGVRAVVLAGSLPPGVPRDAYAQLVRLASGAGVPTLVDADADALREALAARPTLVKPNAEEALRALGAESHPVATDTGRNVGAIGARPAAADAATRTTGAPGGGAVPAPAPRPTPAWRPAPTVSGECLDGAAARASEPEPAPAPASDRSERPLVTAPGVLARRLVEAGARHAVVSAGADGLVACWGGRLLAVVPPRVVVGNATGAGDAASAALALALARGTGPAEALAHAVALSAAAVAAPLAGDVAPDVLAELAPLVAVRDLT